jgi:NADH dehydrogenase FAD-containing subunit
MVEAWVAREGECPHVVIAGAGVTGLELAGSL